MYARSRPWCTKRIKRTIRVNLSIDPFDPVQACSVPARSGRKIWCGWCWQLWTIPAASTKRGYCKQPERSTSAPSSCHHHHHPPRRRHHHHPRRRRRRRQHHHHRRASAFAATLPTGSYPRRCGHPTHTPRFVTRLARRCATTTGTRPNPGPTKDTRPPSITPSSVTLPTSDASSAVASPSSPYAPAAVAPGPESSSSHQPYARLQPDQFSNQIICFKLLRFRKCAIHRNIYVVMDLHISSGWWSPSIIIMQLDQAS